MTALTTSYALYQRKESGELMGRLTRENTAEEITAQLADIVTGHGVIALKRYAVCSEGRKPVTWTAARWWDLKVEVPRHKLVRVSADTVVSELIRDQADNNRPGNASGQTAALVMQQMVRLAIAVIQSLGFEVARKVDDSE